MAIERMSNATLLTDPVTGRHQRVTNGADIEAAAALPEELVWVDCPPCQTHGAPPTENPYHRPNRKPEEKP